MTFPILTTKLYCPPVRENFVSRTRLIERVKAGVKKPFTLLSAPAGYGKTTLFAEWHAGPGSQMPVAWISLDSEDNDLSRFLMYLITALGTLKAGIGASALAILQSSQTPLVEVTLTTLLNDLVASLSVPFALVLDDYHLITSKSVHEALAFLLDHLPPQMHLVILTRADPPLPLSNLRVRNQLTELRAADLRFTPDEAAVFLNNSMGLSLSAEAIGALEERTEGWIAGLQLAALSMQGRGDVQDFISVFTGSHHYIVDYLVEEVLSHQPMERREFLLKTSILDRMTASLCNALTNQTNGQMMLDYLEHANVFVIPLDDEQRWYRYHQLFADAIRNHLRQAQPDWSLELHRRAFAWYEQHGFVSEAIQHALAGEDMDQAVRLIERNAVSLLTRGELVTLLEWLKSVEPLISGHPWLCVFRSWALTLTGQLDSVEHWLQEAELRVKSLEPAMQVEDMMGHITAIRAYLAVLHGDALHGTELARQALTLLPRADQVVRSAVTGTLGRACWVSGDLEGANRAFAEAALIGQSAGNIHLSSGATCSQADLLYELGRLHSSAETFRHALKLATLPDGQLLPVAGRAYAGLSKVFYEWNDLTAVTKFTNESIKFCQQWGSADALSISYVMLSRLKQAFGDMDGALEAMDQATQLASQHHLWPAWAIWVEAHRMRLWLAQHHDSFESDLVKDTINHWIKENKLGVEDQLIYPHELKYLTFARVLHAIHEYHPALSLLIRLIHQAEGNGRKGLLIELLLAQALIYQSLGEIPAAINSLERAISLTQPEGYFRVFLDEGAPMAELLRQAMSCEIAPQYIAKLLSEFKPKDIHGAISAISQPIIEPLSERELEVLSLIAAGKSNGQIADVLVIATGTVKKHINNIFGKLGVKSRIQCVVRARELKLL